MTTTNTLSKQKQITGSKAASHYVTVDLFLAGWCSGERLRFDSGSNPVVDAI